MPETFAIKCPACGGIEFSRPNPEPKADDIVTCTGCGKTARFGDLKTNAAKEIEGIYADKLRKMFDDSGAD